MLFGLNRVMLVDAGVALEQIGSVVGTLSPLAGLVATGIAVTLMRRGGAMGALVFFAVICLSAAVLVAASFLLGKASSLAMAGAILATSGSTGFYVVICTIVLGWANTGQAATDYAALYGISRLFGMIVLMLAAQAIPIIGWAAFYIVAALALIAALLAVGRPLLRSAEEHSV